MKELLTIVVGLVAALVVLWGFYLLSSAYKGHKRIDRLKIDATNKHGVIEVGSYDEAKKLKRDEANNAVKIPIGCIMVGVGFLGILGMIDGYNISASDARQHIDALQNSCSAAYRKGDGDLEPCRKWCEYPQNKARCESAFGSKDGPTS